MADQAGGVTPLTTETLELFRVTERLLVRVEELEKDKVALQERIADLERAEKAIIRQREKDMRAGLVFVLGVLGAVLAFFGNMILQKLGLGGPMPPMPPGKP